MPNKHSPRTNRNSSVSNASKRPCCCSESDEHWAFQHWYEYCNMCCSFGNVENSMERMELIEMLLNQQNWKPNSTSFRLWHANLLNNAPKEGTRITVWHAVRYWEEKKIRKGAFERKQMHLNCFGHNSSDEVSMEISLFLLLKPEIIAESICFIVPKIVERLF